MVKFNLNLKLIKKSIPLNRYLNFKKIDVDRMEDYFSQISWPLVFNDCLNVSELWAKFMVFIFHGINKYVPTCTLRSKNTQSWSTNTRKLHVKQRKLHKKYKRNKNPITLAQWHKASREARRAKRSDMFVSEQKILQSNNLNIFWKHVRDKLSHKSIGNNFLLKINDEIIEENDKVADLFNNYFSSVFSNVDDPEITSTPESVLCHSFPVVSFPPEKVYAYLKELRGKLSKGPDNIPQILLKQFAFHLASPLSTIFEVSFQ
ncbi:MAG: hypothetical protein GY936_07530, partial [Ignavibacteriae bacterium]|nr:hypothetical protein [Ignavibacteriota bacterium]